MGRGGERLSGGRAPEKRERKKGEGRGGVVWRWRSGREGVFFRPEILALQSMSSRCEERGEGRA